MHRENKEWRRKEKSSQGVVFGEKKEVHTESEGWRGKEGRGKYVLCTGMEKRSVDWQRIEGNGKE